ncbi:hibernation-specific plasma protein HP-55 [Pleuronectes platessa]|uniref:hibernation-specific plasma protein HP-55 n=1 Tax=Pleuronectes platessa TaxID=8262 RepID=UPI00232A1C36|nr:hibernation-specific plasma protein HP-55 [Pleuronectes platessa]
MRVTVSCTQKKFIMMRAALCIWILSAVVCVGRSHHHAEHHDVKVPTDQDTAPNSVSLVSSANKGFTYRLYRKLAAHSDSEGKNIFFSPKSVSLALAALSVGARGETHQQLFNGLGFNSSELTQANVDEAFQVLLEQANKTSHQDTSEGTAVFVDRGFTPNLDFLYVLKKSYLADGFNVDFTNTVESANTINSYVAEKTKGKIDKLVESLDADTIMYLISYIYFKGKWDKPFDPKMTRKDEFIVDENTKVPVEMMNMEEDVDIYYDQAINTSVLHLPFNSSSSMLLLLPEDMATLENAICPGHVTKWLKWMKRREYDIYLPKFSIKTSYNLKDALIEMGMTDMFDTRADLSGIAEGKNLLVSEVVHKATLDVDEVGATATAATGIGIMLYSFHHIPVLKFNRPFMLVIIDRATESTLFVGKIINPNV